jgi:hypothetical protein
MVMLFNVFDPGELPAEAISDGNRAAARQSLTIFYFYTYDVTTRRSRPYLDRCPCAGEPSLMQLGLKSQDATLKSAGNLAAYTIN